MFAAPYAKARIQRFIGLGIGILFGFLLQKGGLTTYNVIIRQLLLEDFTVIKVMLSATITGMLGVYVLKELGVVQLHPKMGSIGASLIGGLIFGLGFGILGYCPGTVIGAVGQGSLDALVGGVVGTLIGSGLFAAAYPTLEERILNKGYFGDLTLPHLLRRNQWAVVIPVVILLIAFLLALEQGGL
jgi:hypothetical protein